MRAILMMMAVTTFVMARPQAARADSDGYYCAGRGFLAYEQRVAKPSPRHELRIVRFDSVRGIEAGPAVILEDFQVHGMRCRPGVVEVAGWDTAYVVTFSDRDVLPTTTKTNAFSGPDLASTPANLGHWSQPGVVNLEAEGGELFQLVIATVFQRVAGGVERHTLSRVLRRATRGASVSEIVQSYNVFEGVSKETAN